VSCAAAFCCWHGARRTESVLLCRIEVWSVGLSRYRFGAIGPKAHSAGGAQALPIKRPINVALLFVLPVLCIRDGLKNPPQTPWGRE
jgi:hypothetical protein